MTKNTFIRPEVTSNHVQIFSRHIFAYTDIVDKNMAGKFESEGHNDHITDVNIFGPLIHLCVKL